MTKQWYHGSQIPFLEYSSKGGVSADRRMLFFSASANVAKRYGSHIFGLLYDDENIQKITVPQWYNDIAPESTFVIQGDRSYDFPVDTLVLMEAPPYRLVELDKALLPDDGLAFKHEPKRPTDRQFADYIKEFYNGKAETWLCERKEMTIDQQRKRTNPYNHS